MKKTILTGVFVIALLASTTVFAERGRGGRDDVSGDDSRNASSTRSEILKGKFKNASSTKDGLKNVDATCVSTAVSTREDAIMAAWTTFNTDVTETLTARKSALVAAWAKSDSKERRAAVKDAWANAKKERKAAALEYKNAKKAAWATFKTEAKKCGGSEGSDASGESESGEKVEI
ncbi:MAG: hypothetical protein RLZZ517_259 [Candidatus Parcubacteria bacterium]|jgi:hypothetical protein